MTMMNNHVVRVIEAPGSGIAAAYAGWLLAKMGADVARLDDDAPSENPIGLALQALAIGKRSVTSQEELRSALGTSDILLSDDPVALESFAGELSSIASCHPRLVVAVHSIFGLDSPNAGVPAEALDAQAVSGVAWALGDPAREPLTLPPGIVEHEGGAMLAAGALLAHMLREQGQQVATVDIALSEVLASFVAGNCRFYVHHGMAWHRSGTRASSSGGSYPYTILPCADGEVCLCGRSKDEWRRLVAAMGNPAWTDDPRYQSLRAMGRDYPDEVDALIRPWLANHTMAELGKIAIDNNLIMSPVRSIAEVVATPGFAEDGFLASERLPSGEAIVPSLPFRIAADRSEGAVDLALQMLSVAPTPARTLGGENGPLHGLRIIDFGWVWSAPWVGTILGELGAEVIKIEHGKRPDTLRLSGRIFRDGKEVEGPTDEMSPMYHQVNHGKLGVTLNAKEPRAVELIMELVAGADLVIENMSPGSLERSGLGYEQFRKANPKIVMLAMSAAGQFGPLSQMRAYAPTMSSFAGMEGLVGYAGEQPIGALNVGLGDPNASVHGLLAALAALRFAASTGQGCYIDLSQVEALAGVLRPYLIQRQVTGRQPIPSGNRHPSMAPHGVYPTSGSDRWLTIAVADDDAWQGLAGMANGQAWASDPRYASAGGRLADVASLDPAIAAWTARWEREELVTALRGAGVAASPVQTVEEMWRDRHFAARGMVHDVELPFYGTDRIARAPWRFSTFAPRVDRPGPTTGEHNEAVLGGQLGLSADQIDDLVAAGVVS